MSWIKKYNLKKNLEFLSVIPILVVGIFFILYSVLGIVRHNFYGSFGADLGFIDREFWQYSHFDFSQLLGQAHIEPTTVIFSPLYWLWSDPRILILFQALVITTSGMAVFLLAKKHKLNTWLCYVILLSYLMFYGVQNALWFDVHTSVWGAAFFMWFIYFLDSDNRKLSLLSFLLTIGSKENFAPYVFLFTLIYFLFTRKKEAFWYMVGSLAYILLLFKIIYPATLPKGYSYSSNQGLVSGNPLQLIDTATKRQTLFYTFAWVGFLPILLPLWVVPILGNLASYFILGRDYVAAHSIFMHYRVDLLPLVFSALVFTIARYKWLNTKYIAGYLLICLLVCQYVLHLPLSYLTKRWFWTEPSGVPAINKIISEVPANAAVAVQNNIYPHLSEREDISLLWPDERTFMTNSPCGQTHCPWLRWEDNPKFMIVDFSPEWDIRHLLLQNADFQQAVMGMEKEGIIRLYRHEGTASIYQILEKAK